MKVTNRLVLLTIILVAIVLRFYNYFEIPFTHDEFSALFRLKFDSFSELIEKGVKTDTHPAGVQVFMYVWSQLFGYEPWVVKLPFTIFGILSVYLIYLIGKKWYNNTVGLVSAAFLASIQFTVVYSQIARPYISGLFLSLLMVYFWSNLMLSPEKKFIKNGILFSVSATLCAYNHHFSLLFAAIVGISGLFFIKKDRIIKYMLFGLGIFILYIPHLGIFFWQLNKGGVEGWLGKPHDTFIIQYVQYIFNYSVPGFLVAVGIIAFGMWKYKKGDFKPKFFLLALVWFALPFLIGFFYSKYVNAVLQFSVLIFSFYFLFFVIFGHLKEQSAKVNLILVAIILLVNVVSLIYGRRHYEIFYHSVFKELVYDYQEVKQQKKPTIYILDSDDKITDYYFSKMEIEEDYVNYSDSLYNIKRLKQFLHSHSPNNQQLFLGGLSTLPAVVVPVIQDYFPAKKFQRNYFGGTSYLFSKSGRAQENVAAMLDFETEPDKFWSGVKPGNIQESMGDQPKKYYELTKNSEWGPTFTSPLKNIKTHKNNFIDISVEARSEGNYKDIVLVATLEADGERIHWGGTDFNKFVIKDSAKNEWIKVHHSIKLADIYQRYDNIELKTFIWNKAKKNLLIDNYEIKVRQGNPILYSLTGKI